MLDLKMISAITTSAVGLRMKSIVCYLLDAFSEMYLYDDGNLLTSDLFAGNFTSQERQRVLGQSGNTVFEKHYQSQFIARNLQHVVLLRPSQDGLLRAAGSMLRKRDLLAPSDLTDTHKRAICQHPEILQLRQEKRELMAEMRSLAGTIKNA